MLQSKSKGIISPPLHIPRVFRETGNLYYSESSIPHLPHLTMTSSPHLLSPSHLLLFWAPHEVCDHLPINVHSGTSALSPCHCSPLCSHSSVQHLQDTRFIHAMGKAVLVCLTKEKLSTQSTTHRPPHNGVATTQMYPINQGWQPVRSWLWKNFKRKGAQPTLDLSMGRGARNQEISSQPTDGNVLAQTITKREYLTCGLFLPTELLLLLFYIVM